MEPTPTSGYPENPEKQKRIDQLKVLIDRHNFLIDQVSLLEQDFEEKYQNIQEFKQTTKTDIQEHKMLIEQTNKIIEETEKLKKIVSREFKEIIKKTHYEKLEKRINNLGYEDFIYREELMRKLQKTTN